MSTSGNPHFKQFSSLASSAISSIDNLARFVVFLSISFNFFLSIKSFQRIKTQNWFVLSPEKQQQKFPRIQITTKIYILVNSH